MWDGQFEAFSKIKFQHVKAGDVEVRNKVAQQHFRQENLKKHSVNDLHKWHCCTFVTQRSSPLPASLQEGQQLCMSNGKQK